jgi:16S rRNA (cytidine1402-2'-O)-methyltransferase
VARELTKMHEEFIRGTAEEVLHILRQREVRGEITLLIGKAEAQQPAIPAHDLQARLREIVREQKLDEKAALKILAKEQGVSKSEIYRELQRKKSQH